MTGYEVVTLL